MIEVLLTQSVEKLGEPGDIVKVAEGYARNYLFPRKLAVLPTPHNIRAI
jgi:large subunit ribosomal protein L9